MSYRLYTQPLTLKTESKPIDGELLVDTETGHLLVYDQASESINSATKDLYGEMALNEYLVQLIVEEANAIFSRLNVLLNEYPELEDALNLLLMLIEDMKETLINLKSGFNIQLNNSKDNSSALIQLYEDLGTLLQSLFKDDYTVTELERMNKEYEYVINRVSGIKSQLSTDRPQTRTYRNQVKALLDTRVDRSTYNSWVSNYVSRMRSLSSKINFRHIP